jgi:hypothetical protein
LQREEISETAQNQSVHGESGCKGGEFGREGIHVCLLSKRVFDGVTLSAILQVLTRYSASVPQFPVNDRSPFTGPKEVVDGIRNGTAFRRSQFYKYITIPYYGYNRPGATYLQEFRKTGGDRA